LFEGCEWMDLFLHLYIVGGEYAGSSSNDTSPVNVRYLFKRLEVLLTTNHSYFQSSS
jgi:hypothetical protein